MPPDLTQRPRVVLEQGDRTAPAVEQPTDPRPADQPHAELDPAGPVDPREERVGSPPGPQLSGDHLGVPVVAGQPEGAGQDGQVVMARELPDRLDVARDGLVPMVDGEAQLVLWCSPSGDGVPEPVRVEDVDALDPEHGPASVEQGVGGPDDRRGRVVLAPGSAQGREAVGPNRRSATLGGASPIVPTGTRVLAQASCRPRSRPRPSTSAADMRLSRRAYQTGLLVTGTPTLPWTGSPGPSGSRGSSRSGRGSRWASRCRAALPRRTARASAAGPCPGSATSARSPSR